MVEKHWGTKLIRGRVIYKGTKIFLNWGDLRQTLEEAIKVNPEAIHGLIVVENRWKGTSMVFHVQNSSKGDCMQSNRFSFIVDKTTEEEFLKIMEELDSSNKNQTFIRVITSFRRLYFESQLFRRLMKQVQTHENLWNEKEQEYTCIDVIPSEGGWFREW